MLVVICECECVCGVFCIFWRDETKFVDPMMDVLASHEASSLKSLKSVEIYVRRYPGRFDGV